MNALAPWKPPFWLLALDIAGVVLLGLGLHVHYAPGSTTVARALESLALPLTVLGGLMVAAGSVLALLQVLAHRRR